MSKHYHLLLEAPRGKLSKAMAWLQTAYTVRFNRRHERAGHLFQGGYKAHAIVAGTPFNVTATPLYSDRADGRGGLRRHRDEPPLSSPERQEVQSQMELL